MFTRPSDTTNILHMTFAVVALFVTSNSATDCVITTFRLWPVKLSWWLLRSMTRAYSSLWKVCTIIFSSSYCLLEKNLFASPQYLVIGIPWLYTSLGIPTVSRSQCASLSVCSANSSRPFSLNARMQLWKQVTNRWSFLFLQYPYPRLFAVVERPL